MNEHNTKKTQRRTTITIDSSKKMFIVLKTSFFISHVISNLAKYPIKKSAKSYTTFAIFFIAKETACTTRHANTIKPDAKIIT